MMFRKHLFLVLFLVVGNQGAYAQESSDSEEDSTKKHLDVNFSLGGGITKFFGDVQDGSKANVHVLGNRAGFDATVGFGVTKSIILNVNGVYGKLSGNENTFGSHRNFEAQMVQAGVSAEYNFGELYKKRLPILSPFINTGVYYGNYFNINTDLIDEDGNQYWYWSDGKIRDIAEDAPDADDAKKISRDFNYETPLVNGSVHSFSLALGGGLDFHVSRTFTIRIMSRYFFAFTDKIDGFYQNESSKFQDGFFFSSLGLVVNPMAFKRKQQGIEPSYRYLVDFKPIEQEDEDEDGVVDMIDLCARTPKDTKVDKHGCPLDSDVDGIPDYRDKDINTPPGAIVDQTGMPVDYEMIAFHSVDSMGVHRIKWDKEFLNPRYNKFDGYTVNIKTVKTGNEKNLSPSIGMIPELRKEVVNDSLIVYRLGVYEHFEEATSRSIELASKGEPGAYGVPESVSLQVAIDLYSIDFPDTIFGKQSYALRKSIEIIKKSNAYSSPQLKYAISKYEEYLNDSILESVLVQDFLSNLGAFTWDEDVNQAYTMVDFKLAEFPVPSAGQFLSISEPEVTYQLIDMSKLYEDEVAESVKSGIDTTKLVDNEPLSVTEVHLETAHSNPEATKDPTSKVSTQPKSEEVNDEAEVEYKLVDMNKLYEEPASITDTGVDTSKLEVFDLTKSESKQPEFKVYDLTEEEGMAKLEPMKVYDLTNEPSPVKNENEEVVPPVRADGKKVTVAPIKPAFSRADENADGYLSSGEIEKVLDDILEGRQKFTVSQFNEMVVYYTYFTGNADPIDFGGTEVVYVDGVLTILKVEGEGFSDESRRLLAKKYKEADINGDGDLTPEEVQQTINLFMKGNSNYRADKIYELIDLYFE